MSAVGAQREGTSSEGLGSAIIFFIPAGGRQATEPSMNDSSIIINVACLEAELSMHGLKYFNPETVRS